MAPFQLVLCKLYKEHDYEIGLKPWKKLILCFLFYLFAEKEAAMWAANQRTEIRLGKMLACLLLLCVKRVLDDFKHRSEHRNS